MCKIVKNLWPLLLVCSLWLASGSVTRAEMMYSISESELTELENNLATLESHSQERQKVLTEQATLLDQQREELKKLKAEISSSKAANEETKKSLANANAYLTKLEKEEKHKIRVKERQRNLWIGVSSGLLYAWIRK